MPSTDRNLLNVFLKVFDVVSREFKLFSPDFLRLGDIKLEIWKSDFLETRKSAILVTYDFFLPKKELRYLSSDKNTVQGN